MNACDEASNLVEIASIMIATYKNVIQIMFLQETLIKLAAEAENNVNYQNSVKFQLLNLGPLMQELGNRLLWKNKKIYMKCLRETFQGSSVGVEITESVF